MSPGGHTVAEGMQMVRTWQGAAWRDVSRMEAWI